MANFPHIEKNPHLLSQYESLKRDEQEILQLISIIFEPCAPKIILECSMELHGGHEEAKPSAEELPLSAILRKLQERDLITWRNQVNPLIIEIISRKALDTGNFSKMARIIQKKLPAHGEAYDLLTQKTPRHVREMRIGLYLGDFDHFNKHLLHYYDCPDASDTDSPLADIVNNPFAPEWFKTLPPHLQLHGLHEISRKSLFSLEPFDLPLAYLQDKNTLSIIPPAGWPSVYYLLISNLLLRADLAEASRKLAEAKNSIDSLGLRGWLQFMLGNNSEAINCFKEDLDNLRLKKESKNVFYIGIEGLFFILALLKSDDYRHYPAISAFISIVETEQLNNPLLPAYKILRKVTREKLETFKAGVTEQLWHHGEKNAVTALFMGLGNFWLNGSIEAVQRDELAALYERAKENGYNWLAMEFATLLVETAGSDTCGAFIRDVQQKTGLTSLLLLIQHEKTWQRALKALNIISLENEQNLLARYRLIWLVKFKDGFVTIAPREQRMTADGQWSRGRSVALKRLYSGENLAFATEQDQRIRSTLHKKEVNLGTSYEFDMDETLSALAGHPLLFAADNPSLPVQFSKGEPELHAMQAQDKLHLKFSLPIGDEKILAVQETPTRFKIIEISAKHRKIYSILGDEGLVVPAAAKNQVLETLGTLSSCLTVHSDIGATTGDIKEVFASDKIIMQLFPVGTGFRISMMVKPFGGSGPYLYPGQGSENVIAEIHGKRRQTRRNLERERENCAYIVKHCPTLNRLGDTDGEWFIEDLQDCLEVLQEIETLGDNLTIEWPEGEKLSVRHHASFNNFHMHIKHKHNWFEVDGKLSLDQDKVIEMKQLIEIGQKHSGRFIPLGKGEFLALSREFRKQLDELASFANLHGQKLRIHPLACGALEPLTESGITLTADTKWHDHLQLIRESRTFQPEMPKTLQAQLRDYQIEGYKWLARLKHWGVGACLADDMGLGKTIQTLAIIVQEAPHGPSLVVAPTSVCMNWQAEIRRFAPTLRAVLFGGKERGQLLDNLGPFDVLICSYGLLQQENTLLSSREWRVIVLDEAQAIKNIATKRSRAAMELEGHFKMITTGTPIENHLGELWNLFNFINPGLLGSLDQFNHRFAIPIEKEKDPNAQKKLKKLIQPFILRRLKSQVLEELPPRTEIELLVDMSQEESAFYEALRIRALEKIERAEVPHGHKRMQILAEIMKLRQASCNPSLVQPNTTIRSSKLELFGTVIKELLENRHKALVFSQFTSHLRIIRSFLDEQNITYKYLDGSTPALKRQAQVAEFQAGDGDLFLISLKAGGVGLNLTAADYVIHMDPWWNPAVEDQASDRAHRIGQIHPVTVYRLVTKNTIEEKILRLHRNKRELADNLLQGSDMSNKLMVEDLIELMQSF
ncbi:MAG: DEAD/DEAH box helicase [Deltaproteobacteria bacterium]|nr:DEAD/DEAH box helicase [Deltaproteobacteria bacterium]